MGWRNPPVPWRELERRLSEGTGQRGKDGRLRNTPAHADGGDSPAWSRKRQPFDAPTPIRRPPSTPYAELHCHSAFSFLDGASQPEALATEAARLGLDALALTDRDGFYGVVRFAEAARAVGLPTVFGAELTVAATDDAPRRNGHRQSAPPPHHLVVLARNADGYARLARAITEAQLAGAKEDARADLDRLGALAGGHWVVLTGCRRGLVRQALETDGPRAAGRALERLVAVFGRDHVAVELTDHGDPLDAHRNDALAELAVAAGVTALATNNVHYATPAGHRLANALAATRHRADLDFHESWLAPAPTAHLRAGDEQARRFRRYPGVVAAAAELGRACAFDLSLVAPRLPDWPVPDGHTPDSWLAHLVEDGARRRYGTRAAETTAGAWAQIDHELDTIRQLGFAGYFLIVHDIVGFCEREHILCQGRGSAANSAVCYALGITKADAVSLGLLFERFLSPERDGPPDIDLDIESDRREEVIRYVYDRYGRDRAAQVANVITYRARSAVRDAARALGHPPGRVDVWSKQVDHWGATDEATAATDVPADVRALAREFAELPRHLGIHSGGMVLCEGPVIEVCPVEHARMAGRTVLQWDKDDCAAAGLVKFDLLGLGMLTAVHLALDAIAETHGEHIDLAALPQEPEVYDMLCAADTVGVFQVESRAQMATLPRLRPREFYDLVVQVAIIRPGPIQGGSVHPYIRRRNGREPVTYLHPLLEPTLKRTLGVPLFQEQLMQMAVDAAGFTAAEADELRQAMSAKRSHERMEALRERLDAGMAERGLTGDVAEKVWTQLEAFAAFGFPESHSVSFAYLVYASSWLKLRYPAAFLAALLAAQPMGFYAPHTLVADARRRGVVVRPPCVNASGAQARLEPLGEPALHESEEPTAALAATAACRRDAGTAVRLGLAAVRDLGAEPAERIAAGAPYADLADLARRARLDQAALEGLATAGALDVLGYERRQALWAAGAAATERDDRLCGLADTRAPQLPGMSERELTAADLHATGVSTRWQPVAFLRPQLDAEGVIAAERLGTQPDGTRVRVAGIVTHRQRPATASGVTFVNLEDETGLVNVICAPGVWSRHRRVATTATGLVVDGRLERTDGVTNVVALGLSPLEPVGAPRSRDFR